MKMNKKQLREDIWNEIFDRMRQRAGVSEHGESLNDWTDKLTNAILAHMGHHRADYLDDGAVAQIVERGEASNQPVAEVDGASPSRPIPAIETENVWKSSLQYTQSLLKSASDMASVQSNRINKAVAYLTGLSMFGTAKFSKDIGEAIDILQGTDYFTRMQQTEMDSIKASGV